MPQTVLRLPAPSARPPLEAIVLRGPRTPVPIRRPLPPRLQELLDDGIIG